MSVNRIGRALRWTAFWGIVVVMASTSCVSSDRPEPPPESDDSGVEVVENPARGVWRGDEAWTVEEVVAIGGVDRDASYQFGKITGLDVDTDGNVYVVDRLAQNVSVFDASGEYVRTIGGPGEGPGEFGGNAAGVFILDNQVVVPDPANRRVSRFALDGTFDSDYRLESSQGVPLRYDAIGGANLLVQRRARVPGNEAASSGDVITALVPEGQVVDTVVTLEPGQSVQITGGLPKIRQFSPDPVWDSAYDGRLVTAMTNDWRFNVYDAEGVLLRVIRRPVAHRPVRASDRRNVVQALREMYRVQAVPPNIVEDIVKGMEFADEFPAFASLALGPRGSLWVQTLLSEEELAAQGGATVFVEEMGSRVWDVVNSEGQYLGQVAFPVRFKPIRVVKDRFYGIAKDDLDVESVKVFRVVTD